MKAIRHTGIVTNDLYRALHFYTELLDLKVIKRMDESGEYIDSISASDNVNVTTVKIAADDGNLIELLCYRSHPGIRVRKHIYDIGISHIAFTVDNVEMEFERLSKAGVQFNSPPKISPDGYARVAFCMDPDGNYIELVEVLS